MMKILIFFPCLLILNESDSFTPNIVGLVYILSLYAAARTHRGKMFFRGIYRELINKFGTLIK